MRGPDDQTSDMFSYLSPEQRVRPDHPLRAVRRITDAALAELSPRFTAIYSELGRPSIPARAAAAGVGDSRPVFGSQRAVADGRDRLQRAVSLVHRPQSR